MRQLHSLLAPASLALSLLASALVAPQASAAELLTCTGSETDLTAALLALDGDDGFTPVIPTSTSLLGPPFAGLVHVSVNGAIHFGTPGGAYDPAESPEGLGVLPVFAP